MKHLLWLVIVTLCSCGSAVEDPAEELGSLAIGGKSDDPVTQIDVRVEPGGSQSFRFDAPGDLTISLFQRNARTKALLELVDRDPVGAGEVSHRSELGLQGNAAPSDAPSLEVLGPDGVREYELIVHNAGDDDWLDAKLVFSKPVETECLAYERPDHWFEPLATCRVISAPKLEDESKKVMQSVDFCVGRGQVADHFDDDRHDTLQVIGTYSYSDPDHGGDSFTAKLRDPVRLNQSDGTTLIASTRRSQEVTTTSSSLMGPNEEREFREFEYIYTFDTASNVFEFRVKSRPDFWPNWFWEFALQLECTPAL